MVIVMVMAMVMAMVMVIVMVMVMVMVMVTMLVRQRCIGYAYRGVVCILECDMKQPYRHLPVTRSVPLHHQVAIVDEHLRDLQRSLHNGMVDVDRPVDITRPRERHRIVIHAYQTVSGRARALAVRE